MYLKDQITLIDQQIGLQLPKDCGVDRWTIKYHGLCRDMFNQNDGKVLLHGEDENGEYEKVTIDDQYDVQIMHVPLNNNPSNPETWGTFFQNNLNYEMKLICVSKKRTIFERIIEAMRHTDYTSFRRANYDTEAVIKNDLKIVVSQDKNYPPEYWAFTIYYGINEIKPIIEDEE